MSVSPDVTINYAPGVDPGGWKKTRAELGNAIKHGRPAVEVVELRRTLKEQRLADRIREVVDSAPPLTDEQRRRLAELLVTDGGGRR